MSYKSQTCREMPPPHDGNEYLPFGDLIKVERIGDTTYRSIALPFSPGGHLGIARSYGGHVYAQSAWAACQTVAPGFLLYVCESARELLILVGSWS